MIYVVENTVIADGKLITKAPKTESGVKGISVGACVMNELRKAHEQYLLNKLAYGASFHDTDLVICKDNGEGSTTCVTHTP